MVVTAFKCVSHILASRSSQQFRPATSLVPQPCFPSRVSPACSKDSNSLEEFVRLAKFTDVNRYLLSALALAGLCFLYIPRASAQAHHAVEDKGFTAFEEFRGTTSDQGQVFILDTSIGYDFNSHIGFDVGAP